MSDLGPTVPWNWYLLGPATKLRPGQVAAHSIAGHDLVVFRGHGGGAPIAFAAHCAHMGSHLSRATVAGDRLRCPLHHRLIDAGGCFGGAGGGLRQPAYPVYERLGGLFVFLGDPAALPDLGDLGLDGNAVCYAGERRFPLPWQWLVANGLDIEHLATVHDRTLLRQPTLDRSGDRELRLRYLSRPSSRRWSDRLMARLAPEGIHGTVRSIGGSMMLVEARTGRRETFILLSFLPQHDGGTLIRGLVGIKGKAGLANQLSARVARTLFKAFLRKDLAVLEGMRWHEPHRADGLGDRFMAETCAFFRGLPGA